MKRKAAKHLADASRELKAASGTPASAPLLISEEKVNNTESLPQEEIHAPEPLQLLSAVLMISVSPPDSPVAVKEEAAEEAAPAGAASADATRNAAKLTAPDIADAVGLLTSSGLLADASRLVLLQVKQEFGYDAVEMLLNDGLGKAPPPVAVSSAAPTLPPRPLPPLSASPTASFALQVETAFQKLHEAKVHLAIKKLDVARHTLAVAQLAVAKKKLLEVLHGTPRKELTTMGRDVWLSGEIARMPKSVLVAELSEIPPQEFVIGAEFRGKSVSQLREAVQARGLRDRVTSTDGRRRKLRGRELIARLADPTNKIYASSSVTSQFRGVSWSKREKKWKVQIQVDGKKKNLGSFSDEEKAGRAFDKYVADNNLDRPLNIPVAAEEEDGESSSEDEK